MNAHTRIDAAAQLHLSTYYVRDRSSSSIVLGLYEAEKKRLGVWAIEINPSKCPATIEVGQTLLVSPGRIDSETWRNGFVAKRMIADAVEIVPYSGRVSPKIDGLDSATCKNLATRIGVDFARTIADDPSVLENFRYSPEKRAIIREACERETMAADRVSRPQKNVLQALLWAGAGKTKARSLVKAFQTKPKAKDRREDSPYRLLFDGLQSFKTADRFASKLDPVAAERDRPQAIVIAALRTLAESEGHSLATKDEIEKRAWIDFALSPVVTRAAIEMLASRGAVVEIADPTANASPGNNAFALQCFGVDLSKRAFVGLATLVRAERYIASFAERAAAVSPAGKTDIVENAIANAAHLLNRPGFVLDEQQSIALRRIFTNRLSIITGPPGSGKTTIAALANAVASKFYRSGEPSIFGVALAGRAASALQNAASLPLLQFSASTIHRALGLEPEADGLDTPISEKMIDAPVLVIDECSMINSLLLACVLDKTSAEHVVLLGDVDQLPPIGAGAPFADMIANDLAPVTRLERNYRTDLAGIRDLSASINDGTLDEISPFVESGGVAYREQSFGERGRVAGNLWRNLVKRGASPHEIVVITPRNVGDEGTTFLNRDIRSSLGFGDALQVGDIILVTKNVYDAPSPDGGRYAIFNGERCTIVKRSGDYFDGLFPDGAGQPGRIVRFLHDGEKPPEGTAYGYALTVHKAQGSQFDHVVLVTARPDRFVSRASIYTSASRARLELTIIGDESELGACADCEEKMRRTLLSLIGKAARNG